jgi:hypothetical protein
VGKGWRRTPVSLLSVLLANAEHDNRQRECSFDGMIVNQQDLCTQHKQLALLQLQNLIRQHEDGRGTNHM